MTHSDNPMTSDVNAPRSTSSDTKAAADDLANSAKSTAQDLAHGASSKAADAAHKAQANAATEMKDVASALRHAAEDLRQGSPQERTLSQIANGIADASEAIRDKDLGEIVSDMGTFARRNPAVFLGGAALLGFAVTRFAKASDSRDGGMTATSTPQSYGASRSTYGTQGTQGPASSTYGTQGPASGQTSSSPTPGETK